MSVCRICLKSKPRKHIAELKISTQEPVESKSYKEIIKFCLGIEVELDSTTESKLCPKCFKKIIEFYDFKALALKNAVYLEAIYSVPEKIKDEILESNVKLETELVNIDSTDNGFESDNKEEEIIIKEECNVESEAEFLNVVQNIKYEFIEEKENKEDKENVKKKSENACKVKKKVREKVPKLPKGPKSKAEIKNGPMKVCVECGKYVRNLKQHMEIHLPLELRKKYTCQMCLKDFSSKSCLYKHKKRIHLQIKKQCPICKKMVRSRHHKSMHDPKLLIYECADCGSRFATKSRLQLHVIVHTKDRPHECDVCHATFRQKVTMQKHRRAIHEKERSLLCQYCSKSFFQKYHLLMHLRSHTKEKPHPCPQCGKHFSTPTILRNHLKIHVTDKKYACEHCDMSFVKIEYLKAHMLSHTKEKRFPCQYCGVRFHRSDHRKRHEFTAHVKHATSPKALPVRT